MSRTLQTSTVYVSRVSYLFECNANDTYVLRMTQMINYIHPSISLVQSREVDVRNKPQSMPSTLLSCHCIQGAYSVLVSGPSTFSCQGIDVNHGWSSEFVLTRCSRPSFAAFAVLVPDAHLPPSILLHFPPSPPSSPPLVPFVGLCKRFGKF